MDTSGKRNHVFIKEWVARLDAIGHGDAIALLCHE